MNIHDLNLHGVQIQISDTPPLRTLWIGLQECPQTKDTERLVGAIVDYCATSEKRLLLHFEHCVTDTLTPPDLHQILCIVSKLMENNEIIDRKVYGTCVQCKNLDDVTILAKNMFLNLYQPRRPFDVVKGNHEANAFLQSQVDRAKSKLDRRA